jgi:ubiquinone/menaquinone biosynthesis C-methylase UbiE
MIIYGLMKFIEKIPERYDHMIGYLTLGGHISAHDDMLARVTPGMRVLDIGCGTGAFLLRAARKGAICTGVDASASMLRVFREKVTGSDVEDNITIINQSGTLLSRTLGDQKFDLITASLMLGELPELVLQEILRQLPGLLKPTGRLLISDELWPDNHWRSLCYSFILAVTFIPNFILTRTMIRPVKGLDKKLERVGLVLKGRTDYTLGVVSLLEAGLPPTEAELSPPAGPGAGPAT